MLSGGKRTHDYDYDAKEIRVPTNIREPLEVPQDKQMRSTTSQVGPVLWNNS